MRALADACESAALVIVRTHFLMRIMLYILFAGTLLHIASWLIS